MTDGQGPWRWLSTRPAQLPRSLRARGGAPPLVDTSCAAHTTRALPLVNLPLTESFLLLQLLLSAAASAGLTVATGDPACIKDSHLAGGWDTSRSVVFLCPDAIKKNDLKAESVLKHELIHVIQDRHEVPLIPEPLLTILSRELIPSGEALLVLTTEEDTRREFECRVLSELLTTEVVAQWLREVHEPPPLALGPEHNLKGEVSSGIPPSCPDRDCD